MRPCASVGVKPPAAKRVVGWADTPADGPAGNRVGGSHGLPALSKRGEGTMQTIPKLCVCVCPSVRLRPFGVWGASVSARFNFGVRP